MGHCHILLTLTVEEYNTNKNQSMGLRYYNSDIHPYMQSNYIDNDTIAYQDIRS